MRSGGLANLHSPTDNKYPTQLLFLLKPFPEDLEPKF